MRVRFISFRCTSRCNWLWFVFTSRPLMILMKIGHHVLFANSGFVKFVQEIATFYLYVQNVLIAKSELIDL